MQVGKRELQIKMPGCIFYPWGKEFLVLKNGKYGNFFFY